jgi:hypothetical protein
MKIRPNDLCFFNPGECGHAVYDMVAASARDRIVEVLELEPGGMWRFKEPLVVTGPSRSGGQFTAVIAAAREGALRPIRPGDGDDETLAWAGRPAGTPVDAIATAEAGS